MSRFLAVVLLALLGACDSPEAARSRGGGPGADTGNRSSVVLMHEGALPYHKTRTTLPHETGPVEPANQAHALSLP